MKRIFNSLFILPIILLLLSLTSYAQLSTSETDQLVDYAMKKFNVVGAAVAIVKDGKVIHAKGYGLNAINSNQMVDENTNFAIASNSKAFTTAALAILVEEGKITWKDKVKDYFSEFKIYDPYVTENFNIEDLITHRSGLSQGIGDLMFFPDSSNFTINDVFSGFQYFRPVSAFRTQFDYDNLLYIIAGELIAKVSGMSWEEFIQQRILKPLEMDSSFTSFSAINSTGKNVASPHSTATGSLKPISHYQNFVNGAAGGIYSNVNDLSKWMLMQLNKGKYGTNSEKSLFSESSQMKMWKIHATIDVNKNPIYNTHFSGYGLGWELKDVKGNLVVSHSGGLPGMSSKTILIPDMNLGIVILTNTESGGGALIGAVSQTITDSYLDLGDFHWVDKYADYYNRSKTETDKIIQDVWNTVDSMDNSQIKVEDYIGIYEDNWFGKIEIFKNGDQLWFKSYKSPKLNGSMHFYKKNTFAIKWEYTDMYIDAFAHFSLDKKGKGQSIKMNGISPDIDFSFDFQDLDLKRIN